MQDKIEKRGTGRIIEVRRLDGAVRFRCRSHEVRREESFAPAAGRFLAAGIEKPEQGEVAVEKFA